MFFGEKCFITALCLSLGLNGLAVSTPVSNSAPANMHRLRLVAGAGFFHEPGDAARLLEGAAGLIAQGEVIEAPADASAFVAIGGVGHLLLSSGAKVRLISYLEATTESNSRPRSVLAASVISGDMIVKLHQQAAAFVQAGDSTLVSAQGSYFHAGVHDGVGIFDASERVMMRLNSWAVRAPNLTLELGNWAIKVPEEIGGSRSATEIKAAQNRGEELKPLRLDYKASARPIGRVESLGAMVINTKLNRNSELLWGNELIQAPEGINAIATLDTIGQVTLVGGSQARLMAMTVKGEKRKPVLNASLLNGTAVFKLDPDASAYVQAAGSKYVAARGSRFRVMIIEGRALIDNASSVVGEIGDWRLSGLSTLTEIVPQTGQQAAARRYLIRPVGLNSNLVVKARATRQIQVRVTDEDDKPVTGAPIIFSLGSSGAGGIGVLGTGAAASTTAKVFTDAQGIASVNYTAGTDAGSGTVTANVEGTDATWVGSISVLKVVPGFWSAQNAIPVIATAAAAAAAAAAVSASKDDKLPVTATGATIIRP